MKFSITKEIILEAFLTTSKAAASKSTIPALEGLLLELSDNKLTITGYNSTLGNKSFAEKKERKDANGHFIGYRNGLNLNDDVCDTSEWSVEIIKARTERMVAEIMKMFAL